MKKPNLKLMHTVHSEARIRKNSKILGILVDIDSFEYLTNRIIEAIRMAKDDVPNAEAHLCLATQLATIARTHIREDKDRTESALALELQLRQHDAAQKREEGVRHANAEYMDPLNHPGEA